MMGSIYLKAILLLLILNAAATGLSSKLSDKILPLSRETKEATEKRRSLGAPWCHPKWGCFPNFPHVFNPDRHPFDDYSRYETNFNPYNPNTDYGKPWNRFPHVHYGRRNLVTEDTQKVETDLDVKKIPERRTLRGCHPRWGCPFPSHPNSWNRRPAPHRPGYPKPSSGPYHPYFFNRNRWNVRNSYDRGSPDHQPYGRRNLETKDTTQKRRVLLDTVDLDGAKKIPFEDSNMENNKRRELYRDDDHYSWVRFPESYNIPGLDWWTPLYSRDDWDFLSGDQRPGRQYRGRRNLETKDNTQKRRLLLDTKDLDGAKKIPFDAESKRRELYNNADYSNYDNWYAPEVWDATPNTRYGAGYPGSSWRYASPAYIHPWRGEQWQGW